MDIPNCSRMIQSGCRVPRALGNRVYEFTEYLVDKLGVTDLGARWDGTLTYHPSCHTLRGMHIDRQPRAVAGKRERCDAGGIARSGSNVAASVAFFRWNIPNFLQNG